MRSSNPGSHHGVHGRLQRRAITEQRRGVEVSLQRALGSGGDSDDDDDDEGAMEEVLDELAAVDTAPDASVLLTPSVQ